MATYYPGPDISYEPVKGYSTPVVRVFRDGRPIFTLSFNERGFPINRPDFASIDLCVEAWKARA